MGATGKKSDGQKAPAKNSCAAAQSGRAAAAAAPACAPANSNSSSSSSSKNSAARVSAFSHKGGDEAKELAKKTFEEKKLSTPADWKEGFVKDDRWVSFLPSDWTPGLKMTDGGILINVFVGPPPERRHFFHKPDLEKFLGRELTSDEKGRKPQDFGDIDPEKFIMRKDLGAVAEYINTRCTKLHGLSVKEALETEHEHTHDKTKKYCLADLKYDLKSQRIELVDQRPAQSSCPSPATPARRVPGTPGRVPSTPGRATPGQAPGTPAQQVPGTPGRQVPRTPSQATIPATPRVPATPKRTIPGTPASRTPSLAAVPSTPRVPATPKRTIPATPTHGSKGAVSSTPVKRQRVSAPADANLKRQRISAPADANQFGGSKTMAAKVFDACYASLKAKAATNVTDETTIFTMIGVGTSLGLESAMLKMLPELLRKAPGDRGASMQFVLDQFQQAFARD